MPHDLIDKRFDLLLLSALRPAPAHGYAVIEQLRRLGEDAFDVPDSAVYPALHRLEQSRLLESDWAEIAGRRRRMYRLTDKGHATLRRLLRRQRLGRRRAGARAVIGQAG